MQRFINGKEIWIQKSTRHYLFQKRFVNNNDDGSWNLIPYSQFTIGKHINYDGDIDDEEEILDWLTNPDNMEMTDSIERANRKMFEKIRKASDYLAVFFCKFIISIYAELIFEAYFIL